MKQEVRHMLAGMGILAVAGLMPIIGSVLWVSDTYATKSWTNERVIPVERKADETDRQVREVQLNQVRHTAVLEHLTAVLNELKITLKDMQSDRGGS